MKLTVKSTGLAAAEEKMIILSNLGSRWAGIALHGASRKGGQTSGEIIEHLAEADTPRDIRPTEDDSDKAAAAYLAIVETQLRKHGGLAALKQKANTAEAVNIATAAQAAGLKAAGNELTNILRDRVSRGVTNDGGTAAPVTEAYAAWRSRRFGIPPSEVFKATGQLLAELTPANLRLTRT